MQYKNLMTMITEKSLSDTNLVWLYVQNYN